MRSKSLSYLKLSRCRRQWSECCCPIFYASLAALPLWFRPWSDIEFLVTVLVSNILGQGCQIWIIEFRIVLNQVLWKTLSWVPIRVHSDLARARPLCVWFYCGWFIGYAPLLSPPLPWKTIFQGEWFRPFPNWRLWSHLQVEILGSGLSDTLQPQQQVFHVYPT